MGSFNRGNRGSGGGFNRGSGGRPTMHRATCSDCGSSCEVPFRPTGSKPVYCSNCFEKQGGGGRDSGFGGDRRQSRSRFDDKQMHHAVCAKCDRDCEVPFRPTSSKPVYCDSCFGKGGNAGGRTESRGGNNSDLADQIKKLNYKMDQLLEIFIPKSASKKDAFKEKKKVAKEEKVEKKKVTKKVAKKKTKKAAPKKKTTKTVKKVAKKKVVKKKK